MAMEVENFPLLCHSSPNHSPPSVYEMARISYSPPSTTLAVREEPRGFEVMLRSGHVVRLAESFDADALRRLIDVTNDP
jgi:hypothetical protein